MHFYRTVVLKFDFPGIFLYFFEKISRKILIFEN